MSATLYPQAATYWGAASVFAGCNTPEQSPAGDADEAFHRLLWLATGSTVDRRIAGRARRRLGDLHVLADIRPAGGGDDAA